MRTPARAGVLVREPLVALLLLLAYKCPRMLWEGGAKPPLPRNCKRALCLVRVLFRGVWQVQRQSPAGSPLGFSYSGKVTR